MTWRRAMREALYGPGGFYARGELPGGHFRTSVHVSPGYAEAFAALLGEADRALGHPPRLDLADVGAGRGELLAGILAAAGRRDPGLAARVVAHGVEIVPRPPGLDPRIGWSRSLPPGLTGLVVASEWLDNVPLDAVELTGTGLRLLLVDPATGEQRPGPPPSRRDEAWLRAWWPLRAVGERAEVGWPRCRAWAGVVRKLGRGLAVAADYSHTRQSRPSGQTLTGFLAGREVPAIPDGSRDLTAHVALDACAGAGRAAGGACLLTTQRNALRALGTAGRRPAATLAGTDPAGYLRALARASHDGALLDPGGLGGFGWLVQAAGVALPARLAVAA